MSVSSDQSMATFLQNVRNCTICKDLPLGPKPLLQLDSGAKILIAGQAPGRITHEKGIPFDDPSGVRLRDWLGVDSETFYNPNKIAILPMGFCFPGTGKSGDLPPRSECAQNWRRPLLDRLIHIELTLIIGQYATQWHIDDARKITLTARVKEWQSQLPKTLVLPHPSPRNNRWLARNPWFAEQVLPALKNRVSDLLSD